MENEITAIPRKISGKGVEITINAPILSDSSKIVEAIGAALMATSDAIVLDVTEAHRDIFADSPPMNTISAYGDAETYYSSGRVPFWRGGLIGSFQDVGEQAWNIRLLSFTASYAGLIEEGGILVATSDFEDWLDEKAGFAKSAILENIAGGFTLVTSHPYTEAVAIKIQDNLVNFGYLEVFSSTFISSVNT